MNNLILALLPWVQEMKDNPFMFAFEPYGLLLGGLSYFFAFFFSVIGLGIYLGTRKSFPVTIAYFFFVFIFMAVLLPPTVLTFFGIIAALMTTSLLYYALVVKRAT